MKLPIVSGLKVKKMLIKNGFIEIDQTGSHIKLVNGNNKTVIVPMHPELAKGTLLSIINQSRMEREEFIKKIK